MPCPEDVASERIELKHDRHSNQEDPTEKKHHEVKDHIAAQELLNDRIIELFWEYGELIEEIHFAVNTDDEGSPLVDASGNVLPEVTIEYVRQVIADAFRE